MSAILGVAKERGVEREKLADTPSHPPHKEEPKQSPKPNIGRLDKMVGYLEEEIRSRRKELKELKTLIEHTRSSLQDVEVPHRARWWLKWRWHPPKK